MSIPSFNKSKALNTKPKKKNIFNSQSKADSTKLKVKERTFFKRTKLKNNLNSFNKEILQ